MGHQGAMCLQGEASKQDGAGSPHEEAEGDDQLRRLGVAHSFLGRGGRTHQTQVRLSTHSPCMPEISISNGRLLVFLTGTLGTIQQGYVDIRWSVLHIHTGTGTS